MAIVLRYVDKNVSVIERFVGIEHVTDTSTLSLKAAIDGFFSRHGLSISKLRGQGYDGASNMRDMQLQELNSHFPETNTELLLCVACLSPMDQFYAFDKHKLIRLAHFYLRDYSHIKLLALEDQLENYIADMRSSIEFLELNVATATVERVFSAMNIVKTDLRNRMGDEWLNDSLLAYVEKDIFDIIDKETIMQRFQNMKPRRGKL
ncbi:hypothetical protein Q3G72_024869 [Acer saccharum]|nr:hypothetical protein Q3G72_024869 [Acer saccharum]